MRQDGEVSEGVEVELVLIPTGTANALYYHLFPPESPSYPSTTPIALLYCLLAFLSPTSTSALPLSLALNTLPSGEKVLTTVVSSTALHACLLHTAERLRHTRPELEGTERFKVAAQMEVGRWWDGHLTLRLAKLYDPSTKSWVKQEEKVEGPFSYLVSALTSRFEQSFLVAPFRSPFSPLAPEAGEASIDVVAIRPLRRRQTRELVEAGEGERAREEFARTLWDVTGRIYEGGKHVDVLYDDAEGGEGGQGEGREEKGRGVVEVWRCEGLEWVPSAASASTDASQDFQDASSDSDSALKSRLVCLDGSLHDLGPHGTLHLEALAGEGDQAMPDRPTLSLAPVSAPSRRPSLRRSLSGAASSASSSDPAPRSPLSQCTPVTPQNAHFWDSYFPPSQHQQGTVALQTPPIGGPTQGGFFAGGAFPGRRALLRRNSSLSSVASSVQDEEDEEEPEWTAEEEEKVRLVYEACLSKHFTTEVPFPLSGPPPSNFTNTVARAILRTYGAGTRRSKRQQGMFFAAGGESETEGLSDGAGGRKWNHGLRSTRLKILALAKERQTTSRPEDTPRQAGDPDATPKRRKPLARQDSMDFLPDMTNMTSIARLSNMLRPSGSESTSAAPPQAAASARIPPTEQLGTLGIPLMRSLSSRPSSRMQRTNSLQAIAGSPSQPARKRPTASFPEPVKLAPSSAEPTYKSQPASSARMSRTGSESSVLPAPPLARHLSFSGSASSNKESSFSFSPTKKGASTIAQGAGLLTPPPSLSKKRGAGSIGFSSFLSPTPSLGEKNPLGLTLDAEASKRPGLASAFNSPVLGTYPSPSSVSPKKKKAKIEQKSPVKAPSFAPGLGLGLGIGGMDEGNVSALTADLGSMRDDEDSPFYVRPTTERPTDSLQQDVLSPLSTHPPSFTLLDPSISGSSLAGRRNSPPKLVLTPSLSPSSSPTSSTYSAFPSASTSATSLMTLGKTPSPLDPTFDLNALKLESLNPSPVGSVCGMEEDEDAAAADSDESDFGCDGGSNTILAAEYVKAGHEARLLRNRLGEWAWERK
ncbi:Proteophosphoglycan ppg4 [Rhodotorula toruloides ATCC 204091]|nr:Proteophosphoglycan ppg4 [Rhodotorula toruloides ATCC 204091]